ncbi:hypothetical protein [Rhodoferax sp.]|uniref:hypothetical protein n=1 Tax=Rhodoferax sp. TaxID=50421 RepID=UPI0019EECA83|nr:hypothetical protein [Rhodoferax sp.]
MMTDFIIKKLPYDLSSHAGLALIGQYLKSTHLKSLLDSAFPIRAGIANSDVLKSYIGLLSLGKNDFDAIENFRDNDFFKRALDLRHVPSSPTLRQRFDSFASQWFDLMPQINHKLLSQRVAGKPIDFGALDCSYTPVDLDTFAMNNSFTKKELVGRTYAGLDGYCPFAVYLGSLGYCLERLPSGKFDTNYLVCQLAAVAMNLLRMIGQNTLNGTDSPVRHTAKHRRIRTVMQEIMFKAARMIKHAGRWIFGLGESDSGFAVFERHYGQLKAA